MQNFGAGEQGLSKYENEKYQSARKKGPAFR